MFLVFVGIDVYGLYYDCIFILVVVVLFFYVGEFELFIQLLGVEVVFFYFEGEMVGVVIESLVDQCK